nr:sulfite exporter TauE/SafE family protein [Halosolutus halophilus]
MRDVAPRRFGLASFGLLTGLLLLGDSTGVVAASLDGPLATVPLIGSFPTAAFLAHWWIFPASIAFSTIALASGVSGALFFSPFFLLVVGLQPAQAIGAGLLTEVFGMGNGLRSYVKQGLVDYATAKWLLLGAVPRSSSARSPHSTPRKLSCVASSVSDYSFSAGSSFTTSRRRSAFPVKARDRI